MRCPETLSDPEQVIVGTAICKFVTQMYTPFVNQSAPHESARYQMTTVVDRSRSAMC